VVEVDAILRALVSLDELARAPESPPGSRGEPSVVSRWLRRARSSRSNDDDDPPPAPAGLGIPFRPTFVAAHGELPLLGPAFATRMKRLKDGKARQRLTRCTMPKRAELPAPLETRPSDVWSIPGPGERHLRPALTLMPGR
jgi:hypothetical protein